MPEPGRLAGRKAGQRAGGFLARLTTGIVAAIVFVVTAIGAVFLFSLILAAFAAVSALVMGRVWWLRRKLRKAFEQNRQAGVERPPSGVDQQGNVLEGEFEIVEPTESRPDKTAD